MTRTLLLCGLLLFVGGSVAAQQPGTERPVKTGRGRAAASMRSRQAHRRATPEPHNQPPGSRRLLRPDTHGVSQPPSAGMTSGPKPAFADGSVHFNRPSPTMASGYSVRSGTSAPVKGKLDHRPPPRDPSHPPRGNRLDSLKAPPPPR